MGNEGIEITYNEDLAPLEKVLARVKRPGDFFVRGAMEMPLPTIEIEGVGVLSFPVPEEQARKLIQEAERAPYGRGPETVLDTSVRNMWQLPPGKARIGGKSWKEHLDRIVSRVAEGLGCGKVKVSAELYKVLIYERGGFFLAHRDTEKTVGMFGTLVVVLPSLHRGGELIVRHAGREVKLDLIASETSELTFAAFYADCEHEVRPVTEGNRVCLVYNLIQPRSKAGKQPETLGVPLYEQEAAAAASILEKTLSQTGAPAKLVWLLEHQYTPAELSFATLKNADAARAKVLAQAAARAGCAVHLGIVHIEESGAAESNYGGYSRGGSRWDRYAEEAEDEKEEYDEDFEVVEVFDASQHVDNWIDVENRKVDFGPVPVGEGELLPQGALDDEKPDQQRYLEASGNEGASFERAYHRAAVVLWRQDRYADVLLQAGVGAVLPYVKERVHAAKAASASDESRAAARALVELALERWKSAPESAYGTQAAKPPDRAAMLEILCDLGEAALLTPFIANIVTRQYDGTENAALAKAARLLGPTKAGNLLARLVDANMARFHGGCVGLLRRLSKLRVGPSAAEWQTALVEIATAAVGKLGEIKQVRAAGDELQAQEDEEDWGEESDVNEDLDWQREQKMKPVNSSLVVELLEALADLGATQLCEAAADTIGSNPDVFAPVKVVVPSLVALHQAHGEAAKTAPAFVRLWHHAAAFLLARSERPPEPPRDWRQGVTISCRCEDCRELQRFARDPASQTHRFPAASNRRQHLHQTIERYRLDMTHVTERRGRPYTLVCTKTRRSYERRCAEYHAEIAAMATLLRITPEAAAGAAAEAERLTAAIARRHEVPRPRQNAKSNY